MQDLCTSRDLTKTRSRWLLWGLPIAMFVAGGALPQLRAFLWVPAFLVAGVACVANAAGCGRLHCYVTGPLYLLAALATVLAAGQVLPIPAYAIGAIVVLGTLLAYLPEWLRGPYLREN